MSSHRGKHSGLHLSIDYTLQVPEFSVESLGICCKTIAALVRLSKEAQTVPNHYEGIRYEAVRVLTSAFAINSRPVVARCKTRPGD